MTQRTLADFLTPAGFAAPPVAALLRESSMVHEAGRCAARALGDLGTRRRRPYVGGTPPRAGEPVLLVPGFLAGDGTLRPMAAVLRSQGHRTYRSHIRANVGCTLDAAADLEARLVYLAKRRGSRVRIVGHSLGGMLARGVAARRPDLVAGIVTLGSPMLAPGAHHVGLSRSVEVLVRLSRAGLPGLMAEDCVGGACAQQSFDRARLPLAEDIDFTTIYSRRDGVVDWRACIDPAAVSVEVRSSHIGMALDPRVIDAVVEALRPAVTWDGAVRQERSVVEVDRGEIA